MRGEAVQEGKEKEDERKEGSGRKAAGKGSGKAIGGDAQASQLTGRGSRRYTSSESPCSVSSLREFQLALASRQKSHMHAYLWCSDSKKE